MPIYLFRHETQSECPEPLELILGLKEPSPPCPRCGGTLVKVPAGGARTRDILSVSNMKDKGFSVLKRRDKGAYEKL